MRYTKSMLEPSDKPPVVVPYDERRYTKFYLTLLILSTISTAFSLLGIIAMPSSIAKYLHSNPLFAYTQIASVVITLGASVGLVLLWLKRPFGLWLKLSSYALAVVLTIVLLFSVQSIPTDSIDEVVKQSPQISRDMAENIFHISLYVSYGLTLVIEIVFAVLWWFAWKRQLKADSEK